MEKILIITLFIAIASFATAQSRKFNGLPQLKKCPGKKHYKIGFQKVTQETIENQVHNA